jgi:hypothetical protein
MLRLLSFSLCLFLHVLVQAQEADFVFLGKVNYQEVRTDNVIEQRLMVEVLEQYLGERVLLPLVDLRLFKGINDNLTIFGEDNKVLFITEKQKDNTYRVKEYIFFPEHYVYIPQLERAYRNIFIEKMEIVLQEQLDKHGSLNDGRMDFMHTQDSEGHKLVFYSVAFPVYHFSAIRSYLQKEFEDLSKAYDFQKHQQYRLEIQMGHVFIKTIKFRTRVPDYPKL